MNKSLTIFFLHKLIANFICMYVHTTLLLNTNFFFACYKASNIIQGWEQIILDCTKIRKHAH